MSFQQGLSGLSSSAKNLDTIGNNVANAGTVGFKGSQAQFADVFAASLSGGGAAQIGIGVKVAAVAQQFTQGNITTTNNPLDIAINGNGFFRMSTGGAIAYSRNGQFQLDKEGSLVNSGGAKLTGYAATAGVIQKGAPVELKIDTSDIPPSETQAISTKLNLDARETVIDSTLAPFNPSDSSTYSASSSVSIYDSLGYPHLLQTYYVKVDPAGAVDLAGNPASAKWDLFFTLGNPQTGTFVPVPDAAAVTPALTSLGSLLFNSSGQPIVDADNRQQITGIQIPVTTGARPFINVNDGTDPADTEVRTGLTINFTGTTQYGSVFGVNSLSQDGAASGRLSGFALGDEGTIQGRYSNGETRSLGMVVLSNFSNPNGLQALGGNAWIETSKSGPPLTGQPGSSSLGSVQSSAVEDSNVDLTSELVNMITAQRSYQANAQTIKTQDQVLQTLVNLR